MSATAGWYPDPGGGQGLYRFWDGRAWSAATTTDPASALPPQGLVNGGSATGSTGSIAHANYGQGSYGTGAYGQGSYGQGSYGQGSYGGGSYGQGASGQGAYGQQSRAAIGGQSSQGQAAQPPVPAYAQYQARKRSGVGWWVGAAVVALVLVVVAVFAIRAATGGGGTSGSPNGQDTSNPCPPQSTASQSAVAHPADGRVHGGPVSYPELGSPWSAPTSGEDRVPFGVDVTTQEVTVQAGYDGVPGHNWVASVVVGQLQAGDGFFTPEQGSQIVVRCIIGSFYGDNPVNSDVTVNKAATIDGHEAWLVESNLSFSIPNLETTSELLVVAIVKVDDVRSGIFYASIPNVVPQLEQPARQALQQLTVDG